MHCKGMFCMTFISPLVQLKFYYNSWKKGERNNRSLLSIKTLRKKIWAVSLVSVFARGNN